MLLACCAGAVGLKPFIQDRSVIQALGSGTANARVTFRDHGSGDSTQGTPTPAWDSLEWNGSEHKDAAYGSQYEIRATLVSGSTPTNGPALNVWHSLTSDRAWHNVRSTSGIQESILDFDIRPVGGSSPLVTARMTIRAEIF